MKNTLIFNIVVASFALLSFACGHDPDPSPYADCVQPDNKSNMAYQAFDPVISFTTIRDTNGIDWYGSQEVDITGDGEADLLFIKSSSDINFNGAHSQARLETLNNDIEILSSDSIHVDTVGNLDYICPNASWINSSINGGHFTFYYWSPSENRGPWLETPLESHIGLRKASTGEMGWIRVNMDNQVTIKDYAWQNQ